MTRREELMDELRRLALDEFNEIGEYYYFSDCDSLECWLKVYDKRIVSDDVELRVIRIYKENDEWEIWTEKAFLCHDWVSCPKTEFDSAFDTAVEWLRSR